MKNINQKLVNRFTGTFDEQLKVILALDFETSIDCLELHTKRRCKNAYVGNMHFIFLVIGLFIGMIVQWSVLPQFAILCGILSGLTFLLVRQAISTELESAYLFRSMTLSKILNKAANESAFPEPDMKIKYLSHQYLALERLIEYQQKEEE